jgi:hypothetical protein
MSSANVRSVQALEDLKVALSHFADEASQSLRAAELDIRRTFEFLETRQRHWEGELRRRVEALRGAEAALSFCRAQAARDPETGQVYVPDCSRQERAVQEMRSLVAAARRELETVQASAQRVREAATEYSREAQRLAALMNGELPKAGATLERKIASLHAYLVGGGAAGAIGAVIGRFAGDIVSGGGVGGGGGGGNGSAASNTVAAASGSSPVPLVGVTGVELPSELHQVALDQIDLSDSYVHSPADFKKVPYDTMVDGLGKLNAVVLPAVRRGATDEHFAQLDRDHGLDYSHGYQRVYDAFFGTDAIRLDRVGDRYRVISGYHRLTVARDLGIPTLPVRIHGHR